MLPFVEQLYAFGMTITAGVAAGLVFDLYRLLRRGLNPRGGTLWILDLMFWLVVSPVVFSLLLLGNWGELRFYVIVGLGAGMTLYFGLLSPFVLDAAAHFFWFLGTALLALGHLFARLLMGAVALLRWLSAMPGPSWSRRGFSRGGWARPAPFVPPWRAFGRRT